LSVGDNAGIVWDQFPDLHDKGADRDKAIIDVVNLLKVKTPSLSQRIGALSGGNQQKVVVGKWLLTNTQVMLLDEPTRGIDVGAKREIYQIINDFAKQGMAVVLVSSELLELLGLSDRILVINGGRAVEILPGTASEEQVVAASMLHVDQTTMTHERNSQDKNNG
jgi:ABC-type sugar transport system ATPase subunit